MHRSGCSFGVDDRSKKFGEAWRLTGSSAFRKRRTPIPGGCDAHVPGAAGRPDHPIRRGEPRGAVCRCWCGGCGGWGQNPGRPGSGFGDTVDFDHIKRHYYQMHADINPPGPCPPAPTCPGGSPHTAATHSAIALRRRHPARTPPPAEAVPLAMQPSERRLNRPPCPAMPVQAAGRRIGQYLLRCPGTGSRTQPRP